MTAAGSLWWNPQAEHLSVWSDLRVLWCVARAWLSFSLHSMHKISLMHTSRLVKLSSVFSRRSMSSSTSCRDGGGEVEAKCAIDARMQSLSAWSVGPGTNACRRSQRRVLRPVSASTDAIGSEAVGLLRLAVGLLRLAAGLAAAGCGAGRCWLGCDSPVHRRAWWMTACGLCWVKPQ